MTGTDWVDHIKHLTTTQDRETLVEQRQRIVPRLVRIIDDAEYEQLNRELRPLGSVDLPGLQIEYVIDYDGPQVQLMYQEVEEYGLDGAALHAVALENLRRRFPVEEVRQVIETGESRRSGNDGSVESAKLLLVQEYLQAGEELAAVIPYASNLVLNPVADEFCETTFWEGMRTMLARCLDHYGRDTMLFEHPIRVTSNGVEVC